MFSTHVSFIVILNAKDTLRPVNRLLVPTTSDPVCRAGIRSFQESEVLWFLGNRLTFMVIHNEKVNIPTTNWFTVVQHDTNTEPTESTKVK